MRRLKAPAELVILARGIAFGAHAGQVDKLGEQYIGHVQRVTAQLSDPLDQVVAWLHDVLEDTPVTAGHLLVAGMPGDLVTCVLKLTHRPRSEPRESYYARIRSDERAVRVKLADIADNTDPDRLARLDEPTRKRLEEKYRRAAAALGVDTAS